MFAIGPAFFAPITGDHPPGDGLTKFQTMFAGASSADVSSFAIGSGTQSGGTLSNGQYQCIMDAVSTFDRKIVWTDSDLTTSALSAMTFEVLFDLIELISDPNASNTILSLNGGHIAVTLSQNGYIPANPLSVAFDIAVTGSGSVYSGSTPAWGQHHFAVVYRTTGYYDVYIDGVLVHNGSYSAPSSTGSVQLGAASTSYAARREYLFFGARVRAAEMYSGASFTPPVSVLDWGSP